MAINSFLDILLILGRNKHALSCEELIRLRNSLLNNTVEVFYNSSNAPVGYVLYAQVDAFTVRAFLKFRFPRYDYEWGEGRFTLISDVVFVNKRLGDSFKDFYNFLKSRKSLVFMRNNIAYVYFRSNDRFKFIRKSKAYG